MLEGSIPRGCPLRSLPARLRLPIAIVLTLAAAVLVQAQVPIKVLDSGVGVAATPDITFDHADQIVVSYQHGGQHALKLARGSACIEIRTLYDLGYPGSYSSVVVDTLGLPNIVHYAYGDGPDGLRYTLDGGELFGLHTVPITSACPGERPVFDLDSCDRPYAVYSLSPSLPPRMATFNVQTGQWQSEIVPGPLSYAQVPACLAVDSQDRPVIAYCDQPGNVIVATRDAGGWSFRAYSMGVPYVRGLALAFDTVDAPHVAVAVDNRIDVLRFGTLGVTTQTAVASGSFTVAPHGLAIDQANRIRIVYPNGANHSLYVAMNEFGWSSTLIEAGTVDFEAWAAVATDSRGYWAIVYYDNAHDLLKLAGPNVTPGPGDFDGDLDVDIDDFDAFTTCMGGPDVLVPPGGCGSTAFGMGDFDCDGDSDLADFAAFQIAFTAP